MSIIVNIVSIAMFLTAVATPHWAELGGDAPVSAGLFQACLEVNKTCLDTNYHFDAYTSGKVNKNNTHLLSYAHHSDNKIVQM